MSTSGIIARNSNLDIILRDGSVITVTAGDAGQAIVRRRNGNNFLGQDTLSSSASQSYGPFIQDVQFHLDAVSDVAQFSIDDAAVDLSTLGGGGGGAAPSGNDGDIQVKNGSSLASFEDLYPGLIANMDVGSGALHLGVIGDTLGIRAPDGTADESSGGGFDFQAGASYVDPDSSLYTAVGGPLLFSGGSGTTGGMVGFSAGSSQSDVGGGCYFDGGSSAADTGGSVEIRPGSGSPIGGITTIKDSEGNIRLSINTDGSLGGSIGPDGAEQFPSATSDEFLGSSGLDVKWSWMNQAGNGGDGAAEAEVLVPMGGLRMVVNHTSGTDDPACLYQALPDGDFTLDVKQLTLGGDNVRSGIFIGVQSTGQIILLGRYSSGMYVDTYASLPAGDHTTPYTTSDGAVSGGWFSAVMPVYLRMVRKGNLLSLYFSFDGYVWKIMNTDAGIDQTAVFTDTLPDCCGIYIDGQTDGDASFGGGLQVAAYKFFRYNNEAIASSDFYPSPFT